MVLSKPRKLLHLTLRILIFLASLSLFAIIYLPDILNKYYMEDTTFVTKKVPLENPTLPTVTICMKQFLRVNEIRNALQGKPDVFGGRGS